MKGKSKLTLLATLLALLTLVGPVFFVANVQATDPAEWYMTVPGVLDSDYYTLYPYMTDESLTIGFSKFGEMINSIDNVGLEYRTVDPFAPPAGSAVASIPKVMWIQGWFINITYEHMTLGHRCVWACAIHSDTHAYGNDWIRVDFEGDWSNTYGWETPDDPGYIIGNYAAGPNNFGGRKTNGTAVTEPIKVLYDGPRRFVALVNTTIYDHPVYLSDDTTGDIPLVRILITIIFNKVKKEVILLKDIKSLVSEKVTSKMKIQFSNRGEVDLGDEDSGYSSYFHFYTEGTAPKDPVAEGQPTVYNSEWATKTEVPEETVEAGKCTAAGPFPQDTDATYDVAIAINPNVKPHGVVWWAAFWPSLSDWSIDGWPLWWRSMMADDDHWIDGDPARGGEPRIPFYIGEWDFWLDAMRLGPVIQFRGVTVYGVTDLWNGDDENISHGHVNRIDKEVRFQLDEIFNPWDLWKAVHKKYVRHVHFFPGPISAGESLPLIPPAIPPDEAIWDRYCSFAERVILLPDGVLWKRGVDYDLADDGSAIIPRHPVPADKELKVLWSSKRVVQKVDEFILEEDKTMYKLSHCPAEAIEVVVNLDEEEIVPGSLDQTRCYVVIPESYVNEHVGNRCKVIYRVMLGRYEWVVVGRDAHSADSAGAALVSAAFKNKNIEIGMAGMEMGFEDPTFPGIINIPYVMYCFGTLPGTRADYKFDTTTPGQRTALRDDWCRHWPISSSNIISVGGPLANLLTYYVNDFTEAFYGIYTGTETFTTFEDWRNKVVALTCWSKNAYASSADVGYAVIATYKDINGTVIFTVWGLQARDTFYASVWLNGDRERGIPPGIHFLQEINPGVTSIILKINYSDPEHPTFTIVEKLGTISEKPPHQDP